MEIINHYVGGRDYIGSSEQLSPVFNPGTGHVIRQVRFANGDDVDQVVRAAVEAQRDWANTAINKRAEILFQYKNLLEQQRESLAKLISEEHGKTHADALASIQRGLDVLAYACGINHHLLGDYASQVTREIDSYSLRQPVGVCVGITPFNFPAMIALWMFPLAIACGNSFILKPSEKNPSCAYRLATLASEAGVPDGVISVVNGGQHTVQSLMNHQDVAAISFVGSSHAAEEVYRSASMVFKRVQCFGGAKNHAVVLPDADLDSTIPALAGAAFGSAGERCMAISVVVAVGETLADKLIAGLAAEAKSLTIGPASEPNIDMGPLITAEHKARVLDYLSLGEQEGATLIVDGRQHACTQLPGFFLGASLFDHVTTNMQIYQQEIFGPVLAVVRVPDYETALRYVNQHAYGNGSAIFTQNLSLAHHFSQQVKTGTVGINVPIPVPIAAFSFGGWKQSRLADCHLHGPDSIRFYTQLKTITRRSELNQDPQGHFQLPTL